MNYALRLKTVVRYVTPYIAMLGVLACPVAAKACACGCGIFDVGDGSVMPQSDSGGFTGWLSLVSMDQTKNYEAGHTANSADNVDKRIDTLFTTLGGQDQINEKWTVSAELPLLARHFTTTAQNQTSGANDIVDFPLTDLGDMVLNATYTGFSRSLTSGISFGARLPTGRYTSPAYANYVGPVYDRDTLPGTGSTDIRVGGWHFGQFSRRVGWYAQAQYDVPVATRDSYRPGNEVDAAMGVDTYLTLSHGLRIKPSFSLLASLRAHDTGANADPMDSGYQRLLIAPGLTLPLTPRLSIYVDVEVPIAQYVNAASSPAANPLGTSGQLVAPVAFKMVLSNHF